MPSKVPVNSSEIGGGNLEDNFDFGSTELAQQLANSKQMADAAEKRARMAEARVDDLQQVWSFWNSLNF